MVIITALTLLLIRHAEHAGLWRTHVGRSERAEPSVGWAAMLEVALLGLRVEFWHPGAGRATLLLTGPADHLARGGVRT